MFLIQPPFYHCKRCELDFCSSCAIKIFPEFVKELQSCLKASLREVNVEMPDLKRVSASGIEGFVHKNNAKKLRANIYTINQMTLDKSFMKKPPIKQTPALRDDAYQM
jgi:hypothetical protein